MESLKATLKNFEASLRCSICFEILTNAVSTRCNHNFCTICIKKVMKGKSQIPCPLCNKTIKQRSLRAANHISTMVNLAEVVKGCIERQAGIQNTKGNGSNSNVNDEPMLAQLPAVGLNNDVTQGNLAHHERVEDRAQRHDDLASNDSPDKICKITVAADVHRPPTITCDEVNVCAEPCELSVNSTDPYLFPNSQKVHDAINNVEGPRHAVKRRKAIRKRGRPKRKRSKSMPRDTRDTEIEFSKRMVSEIEQHKLTIEKTCIPIPGTSKKSGSGIEVLRKSSVAKVSNNAAENAVPDILSKMSRDVASTRARLLSESSDSDSGSIIVSEHPEKFNKEQTTREKVTHWLANAISVSPSKSPSNSPTQNDTMSSDDNAISLSRMAHTTVRKRRHLSPIKVDRKIQESVRNQLWSRNTGSILKQNKLPLSTVNSNLKEKRICDNTTTCDGVPELTQRGHRSHTLEENEETKNASELQILDEPIGLSTVVDDIEAAIINKDENYDINNDTTISVEVNSDGLEDSSASKYGAETSHDPVESNHSSTLHNPMKASVEAPPECASHDKTLVNQETRALDEKKSKSTPPSILGKSSQQSALLVPNTSVKSCSVELGLLDFSETFTSKTKPTNLISSTCARSDAVAETCRLVMQSLSNASPEDKGASACEVKDAIEGKIQKNHQIGQSNGKLADAVNPSIDSDASILPSSVCTVDLNTPASPNLHLEQLQLSNTRKENDIRNFEKETDKQERLCDMTQDQTWNGENDSVDFNDKSELLEESNDASCFVECSFDGSEDDSGSGAKLRCLTNGWGGTKLRIIKASAATDSDSDICLNSSKMESSKAVVEKGKESYPVNFHGVQANGSDKAAKGILDVRENGSEKQQTSKEYVEDIIPNSENVVSSIPGGIRKSSRVNKGQKKFSDYDLLTTTKKTTKGKTDSATKAASTSTGSRNSNRQDIVLRYIENAIAETQMKNEWALVHSTSVTVSKETKLACKRGRKKSLDGTKSQNTGNRRQVGRRTKRNVATCEEQTDCSTVDRGFIKGSDKTKKFVKGPITFSCSPENNIPKRITDVSVQLVKMSPIVQSPCLVLTLSDKMDNPSPPLFKSQNGELRSNTLRNKSGVSISIDLAQNVDIDVNAVATDFDLPKDDTQDVICCSWNEADVVQTDPAVSCHEDASSQSSMDELDFLDYSCDEMKVDVNDDKDTEIKVDSIIARDTEKNVGYISARDAENTVDFIGARDTEIKMDFVDAIVTEDKVDSIDAVGADDKADSIDAIGTEHKMDSVDAMGTEDKMESIDAMGTEDKVDSVDDMGTEDKMDSVDAMGTEDKVDSIDAMATEDKVDSIDATGAENKVNGRNIENKVDSRDAEIKDIILTLKQMSELDKSRATSLLPQSADALCKIIDISKEAVELIQAEYLALEAERYSKSSADKSEIQISTKKVYQHKRRKRTKNNDASSSEPLNERNTVVTPQTRLPVPQNKRSSEKRKSGLSSRNLRVRKLSLPALNDNSNKLQPQPHLSPATDAAPVSGAINTGDNFIDIPVTSETRVSSEHNVKYDGDFEIGCLEDKGNSIIPANSLQLSSFDDADIIESTQNSKDDVKENSMVDVPTRTRTLNTWLRSSSPRKLSSQNTPDASDKPSVKIQHNSSSPCVSSSLLSNDLPAVSVLVVRTPEHEIESMKVGNRTTSQNSPAKVSHEQNGKARPHWEELSMSVPIKKTEKVQKWLESSDLEKNVSSTEQSYVKYGFITTGVQEKGVQFVRKFAKRFKGQLYTSFDEGNITHVITKATPYKTCDRTLKYLQGIAGKKWIVSIDWVVDSLAAGSKLSELDYEILGDNSIGELDSGESEVPCAPLLSRTSGNHRLLGGFKCLCLPPYRLLSPDQASSLLRICGATVIGHLGELVPLSDSTSENKEENVIIVDPESTSETPDYAAMREQFRAAVVSIDWLYESIGRFYPQPLEDYMIGVFSQNTTDPA